MQRAIRRCTGDRGMDGDGWGSRWSAGREPGHSDRSRPAAEDTLPHQDGWVFQDSSTGRPTFLSPPSLAGSHVTPSLEG